MPDPYELGDIWNFLITHRIIRYVPPGTPLPEGQRYKPNEKEISYYLHMEWTEHDKAFLMSFLSQQGFRLCICDADTMPGIPIGGIYYMLIRDPGSKSSSWINENAIWEQFRLRSSETKEELQIWFFVLWQNLLGLEYTALDRHVRAVSDYLSASFTKERLTESVQRFIEDLRQEEHTENTALKTLFKQKGKDIQRRIDAFIAILEKLNQIVDNKDGSYTQTLLAAKEIEENYDQSLRHLLPHSTLDSGIFQSLYSDEQEMDEQEDEQEMDEQETDEEINNQETDFEPEE